MEPRLRLLAFEKQMLVKIDSQFQSAVRKINYFFERRHLESILLDYSSVDRGAVGDEGY